MRTYKKRDTTKWIVKQCAESREHNKQLISLILIKLTSNSKFDGRFHNVLLKFLLAACHEMQCLLTEYVSSCVVFTCIWRI